MTETGKIQNSNAKLHKPPCKSNYQFVSKIGGNLAIATKIIVLLIHQYFQEATLVFFFLYSPFLRKKGLGLFWILFSIFACGSLFGIIGF
jgi:hypothetical protein